MTKYFKSSRKERFSETTKHWDNVKQKIVSSDVEWTNFLKFSSNIHKHNFVTQALVYSQNKNATMLADYDTWKKFNRYVKRDERSITSFDISNKAQLQHLFDISQTSGSYIPQKSVLNESNTDAFISHFNENHNLKLTDLQDIIKYCSRKALAENKSTIGKESDLSQKIKEKSFAWEIVNSVIYSVHSKHDTVYKDQLNFSFDQIRSWCNENEQNLVSLGNLISSATKDVLREIELFTKEYDRFLQNEEYKKNLQKHLEKSKKPKITLIPFLKNKEQNKESDEIKTVSTETQKISPEDNSNTEVDIEEYFISEKEDNKSQISIIDIINNRSTSDSPSLLERENIIPDEVIKADEIKTEIQSEIIDEELEKELEDISSAKTNYKLTEIEDDITFSPKKVAEDNISIIKLLLKLEKNHKSPTDEEKTILAKYRGWGGIPQIFDSTNDSFKTLYSELKNILSETEYESARSSVNNAHYTDPKIIKSIYKIIEKFGFKGGNILEPSMAIGNFYSVLPDTIEKGSNLYGVEIDSISARIATKLYEKAQIYEKGFEETAFRDNTMDLIIGNIPFGDYTVHDTKYNKFKLNIHDYFFAKSIDKLKPGGIIAFITSKGTLDKLNPKARELFATKADFLGAVRLPNTAFKGIANTDATSDIIFLQKREELSLEKPYWTELAYDKNGLQYNKYFVENPHMMLGEMQFDERRKGMYGQDSKVTTLVPNNEDLIIQLDVALNNIKAEFKTLKEKSDIDISMIDTSIYPQYTFQKIEETIVYISPTVIEKPSLNKKQEERITGLIELRESLNTLINAQVNKCSDEELKNLQNDLNNKYTHFVKKNGNITDKANNVFQQDDFYNLLTTLEISKDGEIKKSAIFTERTIFANTIPSVVQTPKEALTISINEIGYIDFDFMQKLYKHDKSTILSELKGDIFYNPKTQNYELAEEYLSGNLKEKIDYINTLILKEKNKEIPDEQLISSLTYNLNNLKNALPERLSATEIGVKLGSTWIESSDYSKFIYDTLSTPYGYRPSSYGKSTSNIIVEYDEGNNFYNITNKNNDTSVKALQEYGTERISAYHIIEDTLNLKQVTVRDAVLDDNGNKRYVINKKETLLAREKQNILKERFVEWLWKDPERRNKYEKIYNDTFNIIKPREYNGDDLSFSGMNPQISLRPHQKNAIARIIHGKNTLLGHVVGAGKSFTMIAGIMEKKRLGISNKAMLVVPNYLTGQMGEDFLRLYPSAKILVTTKKDFEKNNRKKFISRIALGNYDAVIIGHSQFEKIKVSLERQKKLINEEIEALTNLIDDMTSDRNTRSSIKRIEGQKKKLEVKLKKLIDDSNKDSFINFEQLGIDSLYVDEAHMYKNGSINTKMQNIAGLGSTPSQRAMDMLLKCQSIQEINNEGGVVFSTGTPVSNSMAELFTMQKYLQLDTLKRMGISHFDQWASAFGEVTSSLELAPEGTGYRFKNRFSKFFNLPELMNLFKEIADIKMSEDLNLPRPKLVDNKYNINLSAPSETAKEIMKDFANRAELIRSASVPPNVDNMLKITHEARLLGIDPRLLKDFEFDEDFETYDNSKLKQVIYNAANEYKESNSIKGTQIIFSDIGTPNKNVFNVYNYIKDNLVEKGIPANEICFIHDAKTDKQRDDMFEDMRQGLKRIIIGSTPKLGAGTNIQDRLVALHHVDCPFRPSDIEQREGRILRQGNMNSEVNVYRYATENTFDSYLWQMVENKQKFISQIMTSKTPLRNCTDIDEAVLSFAEVKAIASGDERIKEKIELDNDIAQLRILKSSYEQNKHRNQDLLIKTYPVKLEEAEELYSKLLFDLKLRNEHQKEDFEIKINSSIYTDKKEAGKNILDCFSKINANDRTTIGEYNGFKIIAEKQMNSLDKRTDKILFLKGKIEHKIEIGDSEDGNIQRMENALKSIDKKLEYTTEKIQKITADIDQIKIELEKPFDKENELIEKLNRQSELEHALGLDQEEVSIVDEISPEENLTDTNISQKENQAYTLEENHQENNLENAGIRSNIKKIELENSYEITKDSPFPKDELEQDLK